MERKPNAYVSIVERSGFKKRYGTAIVLDVPYAEIESTAYEKFMRTNLLNIKFKFGREFRILFDENKTEEWKIAIERCID